VKATQILVILPLFCGESDTTGSHAAGRKQQEHRRYDRFMPTDKRLQGNTRKNRHVTKNINTNKHEGRSAKEMWKSEQ